MNDQFDPNDYRKRVLAAVDKRGGPEASDPFELYDLPVDVDLDGWDDARVAERVAEVWGFWQRQRDHPKYRVLVGLLVEGHAARSAELLDGGRRRLAAVRVRAQRQQRDAARFELLDGAVSRLVERYGGIPRDKVAGLDEVGALSGLTPGEVAVRLRRHRVVDAVAVAEPGPQAPAIGPERRRQVAALLDEFGRLTEAVAPPTLLVLLGLAPTASPEQVRASAAAWRSRARELPPERLRAVVDELLVHVGELIEPGLESRETYLDSVAADVADHLRPRVRAAVLVEDHLVAEDHEHLVAEAIARGLDRERATALLAALAAELGTTIEFRWTDAQPPEARPADAPGTPRRAARTGPAEGATGPPPAQERERPWAEPLRAARAALRAGRPVQAQALVAEAQHHAGVDGASPVRAMADEVAAVIADAQLRRRAAVAAAAAGRWVEALDQLEHIDRTAADVPGPDDLGALLTRARAAVERADRDTATAQGLPEPERARALLAVLSACTDHPAALAALAALAPPEPPGWVSAVRDARGDVVTVLWEPSGTPEVVYRVSRCRPDGSWQVLGRVTDTSLQDGGAPPGADAPVYAVVALQGGRSSAETRSDAVTVPPSTAGHPVEDGIGPPPPCDVRVARIGGGSVQVTWSAHATGDVEYRVRRRCADGNWRVVGRTRATVIEDGGAPAGELPVYAVSAAVGGARSTETRSDTSR